MSISDVQKLAVLEMIAQGMSQREIGGELGIGKSTVGDLHRGETHHKFLAQYKEDSAYKGPKILTIDIETAPVLGSVWQLFQQNVSLNMIERDWYILSYCAKWKHEDEIIYEDKRLTSDNEDDSEMLANIWKLLDEADIVQGQNSKRFDTKKINARFLYHGFQPPSSYRQIDSLIMAKATFAFTSNKLAYMTEKFCKKYTKLSHGKFAGFELWKECLAGNLEAWEEMEDYNIVDVLSTEELIDILAPWDKKYPNLNLYYDDDKIRCNSCGGQEFTNSGYHYTNLSKFTRFCCDCCGAQVRDRVNLLPKNKRQSLMANISC